MNVNEKERFHGEMKLMCYPGRSDRIGEAGCLTVVYVTVVQPPFIAHPVLERTNISFFFCPYQ